MVRLCWGRYVATHTIQSKHCDPTYARAWINAMVATVWYADWNKGAASWLSAAGYNTPT